MLQPQDLALTILGAYVRRPQQRTWSGAMVEVLREFEFSIEASRAALARLATRGLLERHRDGRFVSYSLSPSAQELLADGDRRIFSFGRTVARGDVWTFLWHGLPEARRLERTRLATQLRFLGFGSLQDGVWVAASDREPEVLRLLARLEIGDFASVFSGRLSRDLEPAALIATAWNLERVGEAYAGFVERYAGLADAAGRERLDDRAAFVTRTRMIDEFRAFPSLDPELPAALAPETFARRTRAVEIFDAVYTGLEPSAARHFAALVERD